MGSTTHRLHARGAKTWLHYATNALTFSKANVDQTLNCIVGGITANRHYVPGVTNCELPKRKGWH